MNINIKIITKFWIVIHPMTKKGYYPYFHYPNYFGKLNQYQFPQIRGSYSFFEYENNLDCFRYGSKNRRAMKREIFEPE